MLERWDLVWKELESELPFERELERRDGRDFDVREGPVRREEPVAAGAPSLLLSWSELVESRGEERADLVSTPLEVRDADVSRGLCRLGLVLKLAMSSTSQSMKIGKWNCGVM